LRQEAYRLPQGWRLPEAWRQTTRQIYIATEEAITRSEARFYSLQGQVLRTEEGHRLAWERWCINEKTFIPRSANVARSPAGLPPEAWRVHVSEFRENDYWDPRLGPNPDQPGCLAPAEVLSAHPPRRLA
jgi:hypothetical protein